MPHANFPRTIQRGPLAGRRFETSWDYERTLNAYQVEHPGTRAKPRGVHAHPAGKNGRKPAPERPPRPSPRRGPVSLAQAEALVTFLNMAASIVPALRADALEPHEARALALAIVEQAQTSPWFANIVLKVVRAGGSGRLATTVGAIVAVRLARHEVIPLGIGALAEFTLVSLAQSQPSPVPPEAETPAGDDQELDQPPIDQAEAPPGDDDAAEVPPIEVYANGWSPPPAVP